MNVLEASKDIFASVVGSGACVYIGQPFDTIKVRMQVNPAEYNSALQSLKRTVTNEAVSSLWRGSIPAFVGALSENAVAFGINGTLKRIWNAVSPQVTQTEGISITKPIVTGAITGAFTGVVLCPCDVIKCRAQMKTSTTSAGDKSVKTLVTEVIRQRGLRGMFVGLNAQILRDIPFGATFFGSYEILCQVFRKYTSLPDSTIYFMSGGFAGQLGWIATIGFDTIKSAIQTSEKPTTIKEVAQDILRTRGWKGFFVGMEVTVLRAFPANAALFLGYEMARKLIT